jgi:hypothetical protein
MEEKDLAEDENKIVLKPKKERSEAQVKAFQKARDIRLENAKLKKEKIAQVKEEVKNRNKVPTPLPVLEPEPKIEKELVKKKIIKQADPESSDEEVVIVKKKKKKIIYQVESESEEEVPVPKERTFQNHDSRLLEKPKPTIRFC